MVYEEMSACTRKNDELRSDMTEVYADVGSVRDAVNELKDTPPGSSSASQSQDTSAGARGGRGRGRGRGGRGGTRRTSPRPFGARVFCGNCGGVG